MVLFPSIDDKIYAKVTDNINRPAAVHIKVANSQIFTQFRIDVDREIDI